MAEEIITRLKGLTAAKRKLLGELLQQKALASGRQSVGITATLRKGQLPLSFAQERLWFLDRLDPLQSTYNQPAAWRLTGNLDIAILIASLSQIVSRHEVLRTTFEEADGGPTQRISPPRQVPLPIFDLSELPAANVELESVRLMNLEAGLSFDLETGPLIRTTVVRLSHSEHLLLCTLHQAVSDRWSIGILSHELAIIYTSLSAGAPPPLSPLYIQYADYAIWQRQWLSGERLESTLAYWRERLSGLGVLELPTDRPRPPMPSSLGGQRYFRLDANLSTAIHRASRIEGATPFMVLLAGVQGLLSRWTSQDDVPIGSLVAGRTMAELEAMIGRFVNTLTLRGDLSGEPSFREAVQRTRELALAAYAHQDIPFEHLVSELRPERDLSRSPFFQVMLNFDSNRHSPITFAGISMAQTPRGQGGSSVDLVFRIEETEGCWNGTIEYRLDLFDPTTIERLVLRFDLLLRGMIDHYDQSIFELPILPESEVAQLLWEWNDTVAAQPHLCLHELFTTQVQRTPKATALIWGTQRFTYQELDQRTNQLARCLRDLGVGPEVRVGISLERSPDLVISLLGVLKAGGAYVPLDPAYPSERLMLVVEDSGASLLITQRHLIIDHLHSGKECLLLEEAQGFIAAHSESALGPRCEDRNLAYIIYTSGSTGRPKGVAIEHRSAAMLIAWASQRFSPDELSGVLASTSMSFDLSVFELYAPLAVGGTIILAENALSLASIPAASEVTLVNTVPSAIAELLRMGAIPAGVRVVNLAGEPALRRLVNAIYDLETVDRVFNLYGPTEDTTYSTCEEVQRDDEKAPSIGRPVASGSAYVVDRSLNLVPLGAIGELCLGGSGLARGYLGRPELTAQGFIPNPFSQEPGTRLYRTGDLTRYRPDGRLEYLGRIDHQVKVRGFRIELGEVEVALQMHPQIQDAAVLVREDRQGDKRLVAYCVRADYWDRAESPLLLPTLREHLFKRLPEFMVPSIFIELDALPRGPNGKLDRKALPAPDLWSRDSEGERKHVPPSTPVEEILIGIWEELLGIHPISVNEDFFRLGGHSLLATQVVSRARAALEVEIPLRFLFEEPTVHDLAARIQEAHGKAEGSYDQEVATSSELIRLASTRASFTQERFWLLTAIGGGDASYNVPISLVLDGQIKVSALEMALSDIVHRHEVLRANFLLSNESLIQRIRPHSRVSIPTVDLEGIPEEGSMTRARSATYLIDREAKRPFDLYHDSLIRAMLLRRNSHDHILLVIFHHIVIDAWSVDIFVKELETTYREYSFGRPSPISALRIQYSDFAERQRRWMEGEGSSKQKDYWKRKLAGAPEFLSVPADRIRPEVLGSEGRRIAETVEKALFGRLRELCRRKGLTMFMVVFAAVMVALRRYTGREDLVVGTPMANRRWRETEEVIGAFLNTVVIRSEVRGNLDSEELLRRVRVNLLEAFENQDFPFEKLVEELHPGRSLSRSPLFQILIAHRRSIAGESIGLVKSVQIESVGAKFDLTFSFLETDRELAIELEYNCSLYEEPTAWRIHEQLMAILAAMAEEPQVGILDLDLLRRPELHLLAAEWNDTEAEVQSSLVLDRFARHVRRNPSALAVVCGKESLTYAELNSRSERLARRLAARGVSLEVPVAILLDRTPALVIGVLAILKAGGVYVPLDTEAPAERLAGILANLEANSSELRLLVQDALIDRLSPARQMDTRTRISFDWECAAADQNQGRGVFPRPSPQNLAYVLYTSGTSGRPKGVAVAHGNVAAFLDWAEASFSTIERRAVLAATPLTFDLSVFELFLPLTTGGCVVMVHDSLDLLEDKAGSSLDVSLVNTVPSLMVSLLEAAALPTSATTVNLAGEVLRRSVVDEALRSGTVLRLSNLYGPTEATVYATAAAIDPDETKEPTLGRPIRNTLAFVVNEMVRLQPIGAPGELVLGGEGVARGYWSRPDLTAERFIPNPFSGFGARLYRTGDLVRWLPDGKLEFLGRLDRQVKVRGFRIEPGDIEASLFRHEAVGDAAVTSRVSPQGERQLVAYVKLREEAGGLHTSDFRIFLQQHLPRGLVPSAFVLVNDLPRTDRGKIDYESLPPPDWGGEEAMEFIPPRSLAEKRLAEIWSEVLGVTHLSVNDNFFDRGGHSLKAAQVEARLREVGVALPLHRLFERQLLKELAEEIEGQVVVGAKSPDMWPTATIEEKRETRGGLVDLTQVEGAEVADILRSVLEEKVRAIKRRPSLSFPAVCILNSPATLRFQLVATTQADPLLVRLARLRMMQPACNETLFVKVTAPAFQISPHLARMQVSATSDSELVAFTMVPLKEGIHVVEVEVFAGADRVGYYLLETEAAPYVN